MSIRFPLDQAINDLKFTLHNDFVMQNIVSQLVDKINRSGLVEPQNKLAMNNYFNFTGRAERKYPLSAQITSFKPGYVKPQGESSVKNLLIATAIYYLSDLNNFDYHLINRAFNFGLGANDIVVLLLLNNIYDIETFCKMKNIMNDRLYTIMTLKKLSALHKVQFNF